jgi:cellulose biosynthesis protein BcsQ
MRKIAIVGFKGGIGKTTTCITLAGGLALRNEFRGIDLDRLAGVMATPRMADLRNVYSPEAAAEAGFAYTGVGRTPERRPA